jgi:indolepyruvate ferredoxin oxidoreductase alpha subunit
MERSFKKEVDALRLGDGEIFRGEGILAVTKALLQSGVSYVGGYQGAPVSHLLDVMVDAEDLLTDLGVHVETCTNEAAAAAMLGASINYPLRGAVTWKSIVGTNVAADALSNLSSPGVIGGALIVLGEDYGEGASVIQERSYAYAMKSSMWLLDPRPDLPTIVHMVEKGFELSEASHAPVMIDLRVRACHVTGEFIAKDNKRGAYSGVHRLNGPPRFEYGRLAHPPVIFTQERLKIEERLPAAQKFIREQKLNEVIPGELNDIGIIVLGGLTSNLLRSLGRLDLADLYGASRIPIYVLNAAYPLVPEEVKDFCAGKRAVLVVEEGSPEYVEQQINTILRNADINTRVLGKDCLPRSGDYNAEVLLRGIAAFMKATRPSGVDADAIAARVDGFLAHKPGAIDTVGDIPPRPPNFCTGCPERPVFAAIKLMQRELGPTHISADIGCHSFATFAPFSLGNSILGYGMSLASAAAVTPNMERRPISVMGDGGFWHNGLITGVASNMFNKGDGVLIVMQNGYASATGQQYLPSSTANRSGTPTGISIEKTVRSLGVTWLRTVHTYSVSKMVTTLKEAMRTAERGLKVIIADGECMLARQRRIRAEDAVKLKRGERVVKTRYGVDDEICTGDHSCIRLSGCPSLTVKPNPDPLRTDPVAAVIESCVGCGLCGEVAHAAVLCPSFFKTDVISNPTWWDRALFRMRSAVIGWMRGNAETSSPRPWGEGGVSRTLPSKQLPLSHQGSRELRAVGAQTSSVRPMTILIAALGRRRWRRADRLDRRGGGEPEIPGAIDFDSRRRAANRRDHLSHRDGAYGAAGIRPAPDAGAGARYRRRRSRGGERTDGSRPRHCRRLRHPRPHHHDRLDQPRLPDRREDGDGRRPLRSAETIASGREKFQSDAAARSRSDREAEWRHDQRRDAGRYRRCWRAADSCRSIRSCDPRRRQGGRCQSARFPRRLRCRPQRCAAGSRSAQAVSCARRFARRSRMRNRAHAGSGAGIHGRGRASSRVLSGPRLCAALSRSSRPIRDADAKANADGRLLSETARHLALRMSYEDVIRVAQAKIDPARFSRIAVQYGVKEDQPFAVSEFLKPGVDEFCSVLPPWLAQRILAFAERHPKIAAAHWGMEINTASISGFLRFYILAKLRGFRPRTWRFQEEQREIESWLRMITRAAPLSAELAIEIAECARLIKGYGDTHKRGSDNYRTIVSQVIEPALAGAMPVHQAVDAVASARTAALRDPEGEALSKCIADIAMQSSHRIAAE